MSKIYTFLIILPIIAALFFKTAAFYEFDTKQRYIKNTVDNLTHKVMITGVMTEKDKADLLDKLNKLEKFSENNVILEAGPVDSHGAISELYPYLAGDVLDRGAVFSITVKSDDESLLSEMGDKGADGSHKLYYKAKAVCRIEKKQSLY